MFVVVIAKEEIFIVQLCVEILFSGRGAKSKSYPVLIGNLSIGVALSVCCWLRFEFGDYPDFALRMIRSITR